MSVIEMEIKEHAIYKTCEEHDPGKYVAIASQSSGYAKLCCYAVKKLNENEIVTSYENICVALWRMFPKCEKFHLTGFEDMPDTDYMEKLIKLRSTPNDQGYLTGGNVGFDKNLRKPWQLTRKGQLYANEAEKIFSGDIASPEIRKKEERPPDTIENIFRYIWQSELFIQFAENQKSDSVDALSVCAALNMRYSQSKFKDDLKRKCESFEHHLNSFENSGISDKRFDQTRKFLAWIRKEVS